MFKHLRNRNGLTLIEVIVSLAVLGIIIVPLSSLFVNSASVNGRSGDLTIANNIAQEIVEELKSSPGVPSSGSRSYAQYNMAAQWTVTSYGGYKYPDGEENLNSEFDASIIISDSTVDVVSLFNRSQEAPIHNTSADPVQTNPIANIEIDIESLSTMSVKMPDVVTPFTITYSGSTGNPIKIKVHCRNIEDVSRELYLEVKNQTAETAEVYVVQSKDTTSTVLLKTVQGIVKKISGIYDSTYSTTAGNDLLYKIDVMVSNKGTTYSDDNKLVEITELKKNR